MQKITFYEIDLAEAHETEPDSFYLAVCQGPKKLITCASNQDRNQFLHTLQLVTQMCKLNIDFARLSPWAFEKFHADHTLKVRQKHGLPLEEERDQVDVADQVPADESAQEASKVS